MPDETTPTSETPQSIAPTTVIVSQPEVKFAGDTGGAQPAPPPVTEPQPILTMPPAHQPPPVPEVAPVVAEVVVEEVKPKGSKAQVEKDRYAMLVERALKKERLSYLKNLGINTGLISDEHILTLSPDVDVETPEGKVAIDEWRVKPENEKLFTKRETSEVDIDSLVMDYKPTAHNTFPKELMIATLKRVIGK